LPFAVACCLWVLLFDSNSNPPHHHLHGLIEEHRLSDALKHSFLNNAEILIDILWQFATFGMRRHRKENPFGWLGEIPGQESAPSGTRGMSRVNCI
jgi:hypothetical protein